MTSKERAALRAQANTIDTTLMVGKGGVSETLVAEAEKLLDIHELVKGRVLETAMMTPREVCDALCEATGAEGIQVVGSKFVIWRKSEKVEQEKKKAEKKASSPKKVSGNAASRRHLLWGEDWRSQRSVRSKQKNVHTQKTLCAMCAPLVASGSFFEKSGFFPCIYWEEPL